MSTYEISTTVEHCKKCTGKQPEVMFVLAPSAVIQCKRCGSLFSGSQFPRGIGAKRVGGDDE